MTSDHPLDLDHLLVHDRFVRSIARTLLASTHSDTVDDVVQETWLRAAASRPAAAAARPWLARVTANIAFSMRRRAAVRDRAEPRDVAGAPPAVPEPAAILEREALRREIVEAVLALDAPYRDAVLLRYFEGLDPDACAKRLRVPLNTFLSRLHRARLLLKRRLTDESGAPRYAPAVMTALACDDGATALTTATTTISTAIPVAVAAAALVVAVVVWRTNPSAPSTPPVLDPARQPAPAAAPLQQAAADSPARESAPAIPSHSIRGVIVDASGARIHGARVSAAAPGGEVQATSDGDGTFELTTPSKATLDLLADSPAHFATEVAGVATGDDVTIVLRPGVPFRGVVVDAGSGRPIEGATVRVGRRALGDPEAQTTSAASGEFSTLAPARSIEATVSAPGYSLVAIRPFTPDPELAYELRLARESSSTTAWLRIAGGAADVAGLDALPGPLKDHGGGLIEVGVENEFTGETVHEPPPAPRGGAGRRETIFGRSQDATVRSLRLRHSNGRWFEIRIAEGAGINAAHPFEVVLPEGVGIRGRVVDSEGNPVAGANVRFAPGKAPPTGARAGGRSPIDAISSADGTFAFAGLLDGTRGSIIVAARQGAVLVPDVVAPASGSEASPIVATLEPGIRIHGQVTDGDGRPVEGARVSARPRGAATRLSAASRVEWTDALGRYAIEHVAAESEVEVTASGYATSGGKPATTDETTIALEPERVFAGRVIDAGGRAVPGARVTARFVAIHRTAHTITAFGSMSGSAADGDGADRGTAQCVTDPEGRFRIRGLAAGDYSLAADLGAASSDPFADPVQPDEPAGPKLRELVVRAPGAVFGKLVSAADGKPIRTFRHFVETASARGTNIAMGSGRGSFVHVMQNGERASLKIATDDDVEIEARELEVADGEWRELTFELPEKSTADGSAPLTIEFSGRDDAGARVSLEPEVAGTASPVRVGIVGHGKFTARLPGVAAGSYRVVVTLPDGSPIYCEPEWFAVEAGRPANLVVSPK